MAPAAIATSRPVPAPIRLPRPAPAMPPTMAPSPWSCVLLTSVAVICSTTPVRISTGAGADPPIMPPPVEPQAASAATAHNANALDHTLIFRLPFGLTTSDDVVDDRPQSRRAVLSFGAGPHQRTG